MCLGDFYSTVSGCNPGRLKSERDLRDASLF